ncbi:MAG: LCP family protein [Nocardioides sp.]
MTDDSQAPAHPPHRRAVWTVAAISQAVLAVLTATVVFFAYQNLNNNIGPGEDIEHADGVAKMELDGPKQPMNILIMGSDSRAGEGNDIDGLSDIGERADTTILLHVSANRRNAYGVSLPRDAIVDRPECMLRGGEVVPAADAVMFNSAFSEGGAQCTVQTVEALTGIFIDHFLVLDFNGFKDMVDAVNGVEVCLPKEVNDTEHNIFFDAGTQVLTGQDALNYVRERSVLSVTGDIGRMKRQQAFIASMVNRVMSADTLSQPTRIYGFLNAVTSSIEVDSKLDSVRKLYDLAIEFRSTGLDKIKFITVPIAEYEPDPNRLIWTEDADDLWQRIMEDQQLGKDFSEDSIKADDSVGSSDPDDEPTIEPDEDAEAQTASRLAAGLCA